MLELFPLSPQQGNGDELFSPAKELQFLGLCALGSEHWDVSAVPLRVPESFNSSQWICQTQILENIIRLADGNSSPPLPLVSSIYCKYNFTHVKLKNTVPSLTSDSVPDLQCYCWGNKLSIDQAVFLLLPKETWVRKTNNKTWSLVSQAALGLPLMGNNIYKILF